MSLKASVSNGKLFFYQYGLKSNLCCVLLAVHPGAQFCNSIIFRKSLSDLYRDFFCNTCRDSSWNPSRNSYKVSLTILRLEGDFIVFKECIEAEYAPRNSTQQPPVISTRLINKIKISPLNFLQNVLLFFHRFHRGFKPV